MVKQERQECLQPVDPFSFFSEDTDDNSFDNSFDSSVDNSTESALENSI